MTGSELENGSCEKLIKHILASPSHLFPGLFLLPPSPRGTQKSDLLTMGGKSLRTGIHINTSKRHRSPVFAPCAIKNGRGEVTPPLSLRYSTGGGFSYRSRRNAEEKHQKPRVGLCFVRHNAEASLFRRKPKLTGRVRQR